MFKWIWNWLFFGSRKDRKSGMTDEELDALMIDAFHAVIETWDYDDYENNNIHQCRAVVMKAFMDSHDCILTRSQLLRAAKLSKAYAEMVLSGRLI